MLPNSVHDVKSRIKTRVSETFIGLKESKQSVLLWISGHGLKSGTFVKISLVFGSWLYNIVKTTKMLLNLVVDDPLTLKVGKPMTEWTLET